MKTDNNKLPEGKEGEIKLIKVLFYVSPSQWEREKVAEE